MEELLNQSKISLAERFENLKKNKHLDLGTSILKYTKILDEAKNEENKEIHISCLLDLAHLRKKQALYLKAIQLSFNALKIVKNNLPVNKNQLALVYKELGSIYADGLGKYSVALDYFFKGLNCNSKTYNVNFYNNIGSVLKDLGKLNEALKYLHLGLKDVEESSNGASKRKEIELYILENIGGVYLKLNNFDQAEKYIQKGIDYSTNFNYNETLIYSVLLLSLAKVYFNKKQSDKGIKLLNQAIAAAKKNKYDSILIEMLIYKSDYYLTVNDENAYVNQLKETLNFITDEKLGKEQIICLQKLEKYYEKNKNHELAYFYLKEVNSTKAIIKDNQNINAISELLQEKESEIFKLETKNTKINRQNEELEQFAYIVAHDLKEPIRNIGSYCGLLKKSYSKDISEEGAEYINFIYKNAKHMYLMLEDLLKYVTVGSNLDKINYINTNEIIAGIIERHKDKIKENNINIKVATLPNVKIIPIHFNILIENLILNSIKFRHPERDLKITISGFKQKNAIYFKVSDNGIGIQPDHHDSIFQIFRRLNKQRKDGTGIGLSLCKKITDSYQGNIKVTSNAEHGCTFIFSIPDYVSKLVETRKTAPV